GSDVSRRERGLGARDAGRHHLDRSDGGCDPLAREETHPRTRDERVKCNRRDTKTCNYEDAKARRRTHVFHEAHETHETTKPRRGGSTRRRAAAASGIENRPDEQTLRLCVCSSSRFSMTVTAACSAGRSASNP